MARRRQGLGARAGDEDDEEDGGAGGKEKKRKNYSVTGYVCTLKTGVVGGVRCAVRRRRGRLSLPLSWERGREDIVLLEK